MEWRNATSLSSRWSAVKMPALTGVAYLSVFFPHTDRKRKKGRTNDCFSGTPSACKANSSTHTHTHTQAHTHLLLFQWKTTEAEEKSRAGDIHAPPSCAAMIFQAREAKVGASSSIMTLNCASTVCTVSIYWACGCEMPSDGAEKASCVGDLFRHSPHTLSDPVFSNQTESHRPHQQTKKLNLKRTCNN